MPPEVLYAVSFASGPVRWALGTVCLVATLLIFGGLLPSLPQFLRTRSSRTPGENAFGGAVLLVVLGVGFVPVVFLIAAVTNPRTLVTDAGVTIQGLLGGEPTSVAWGEVDRVNCALERNGTVFRLTVVAADGRRIEVRNSGGDLGPVSERLRSQLGAAVMQPCRPIRRG
jgi:hypothetical protein